MKIENDYFIFQMISLNLEMHFVAHFKFLANVIHELWFAHYLPDTKVNDKRIASSLNNGKSSIDNDTYISR